MTRAASACVLAGLALLGCTFEPGTGYATLESARLDARLEPGRARDLDGAVLTDLGYEVALDELSLDAGTLELLDLTGTERLSFDAAHPPPGYTLCHGGHCHREDGAVVPYADVEAELAGGNASLVTVASLPVDRELDLLEGAEAILDTVEPSRELPKAEIRKLGLGAGRFRGTGQVRGGALTEDAALSLDLEIEGRIEGPADLAISRDGPATLHLVAELVLDGTLFDGIDFATLVDAGNIDIADVETQEGLTLTSAVLGSELGLSD